MSMTLLKNLLYTNVRGLIREYLLIYRLTIISHECALLLLEHRADMNLRTGAGTPVETAAAHGNDKWILEILKSEYVPINKVPKHLESIVKRLAKGDQDDGKVISHLRNTILQLSIQPVLGTLLTIVNTSGIRRPFIQRFDGALN